jgi:hypothetical protein
VRRFEAVLEPFGPAAAVTLAAEMFREGVETPK